MGLPMQNHIHHPVMCLFELQLPREPVTGRVEQPDPAWTLSIEPEGGWMPKWYEPLIALVCLMSVAASLLLLAMVVSGSIMLRAPMIAGRLAAMHAALRNGQMAVTG